MSDIVFLYCDAANTFLVSQARNNTFTPANIREFMSGAIIFQP